MIIGGLTEAAEWWRKLVEDTCRHLGRTLDQFNADVELAQNEYEASMRAFYKESEGGVP